MSGAVTATKSSSVVDTPTYSRKENNSMSASGMLRVTYFTPTFTTAGIVAIASSDHGRTFWRHDRRRPSARRTETRTRAARAAPRPPRSPS